MASTTSTVTGLMTERQLQTHVTTAAKQLGWRTYHTWRSDHSEKGFPDLVMIRVRKGSRRGLAVELKNSTRPMTDEQEEWLEAFEAVGFETYLWRPIDWIRGEIERVLR